VSYESARWKRYESSNNTFDALATVDELRALTPEQKAQTQLSIAVDMCVEELDLDGAISHSEHTVTENISPQGATLFTTLEIPMGRFIRLTSEQYGVTAHAAIRSRSIGADGIPRIYIEFIDRQWPL